MTFETLKRSHLKRNILIAIGIVLILTAVMLTFTRAKYRTTQSMPLLQGTINFSPSDFNMVAVYLNKGSETVSADKVPHVGYTLNEEQSTCESPDGVEDSIGIEYIQPSLTFSNVIKKGTKCSVYFDLIPDNEAPTIDDISYFTENSSIKVSIHSSDNIGVFYYYYSIDGGEYIRSENSIYTFEGLTQNQSYIINMYVEDAAGNKSEIFTQEKVAGKRTIVEVIESLYSENKTTLAYDETIDNNLRYIGKDPNNYVYFNCDDYNNPSSNTCELWRIIGVFNENSHGISGEKLVKLIRSESLGNVVWDSAGANNWSTASLRATLNEDYLNGSNSYASTGIKNDTTRNMIENVTWKLGGMYDRENTAGNFYVSERGTSIYNGNPSEWTGKIALVYPSDYGFATSGGTYTNRTSCLNKTLGTWYETSECASNNWIFTNEYQWTLTHKNSGNYEVFVICNNSGHVHYFAANDTRNTVRPTIYLRSDIGISKGDGSIGSPYILY